MSFTLGLDASTQSCSGIVLDSATGKVIAAESVPYGSTFPHYRSPHGFLPGGSGGQVHADPLLWLDGLDELWRRLSQRCDLGRVRAVSGAGQQHGSVYLNAQWPGLLGQLQPGSSLAGQLADGLARATAPIWMDTSTGSQCREIAAQVGGNEVVCAKSGSMAIERFTGPQIRRFWQLDPAGYARTVRIHLVSSFHASVLAGVDAPIDHGDGAGMNLMNLANLSWDPDLLQATAPDLAARLPPLVPASTIIGTVAPYFQQKYGLAADVPVIAFTGDNPSSLVGMKAARPGRIVISLGTSDTFFTALAQPHTDPDGCGHVFGNPMGGFMTLQCFKNGSLAREQVRNRIGLSWEGFETALSRTPPGNHGQLMVPFFESEISPRKNLPAPVLRGSASFQAWQEPEALVRACVEGQIMNIFLRSRWMQVGGGEILLTGGASRSQGIAQIVADVFQVPVKRFEVTGSVALGGAIRAACTGLGRSLLELEDQLSGIAAGVVHPRPDTAVVYAKAMGDFQQLLEALP